MYNRYIPQGDGTYQRSRLPESRPCLLYTSDAADE